MTAVHCAVLCCAAFPLFRCGRCVPLAAVRAAVAVSYLISLVPHIQLVSFLVFDGRGCRCCCGPLGRVHATSFLTHAAWGQHGAQGTERRGAELAYATKGCDGGGGSEMRQTIVSAVQHCDARARGAGATTMGRWRDCSAAASRDERGAHRRRTYKHVRTHSSTCGRGIHDGVVSHCGLVRHRSSGSVGEAAHGLEALASDQCGPDPAVSTPERFSLRRLAALSAVVHSLRSQWSGVSDRDSTSLVSRERASASQLSTLGSPQSCCAGETARSVPPIHRDGGRRAKPTRARFEWQRSSAAGSLTPVGGMCTDQRP